MSDYEYVVDGDPVDAATSAVAWLDRATGLAWIASSAGRSLAVVEGSGDSWWVTIGGRRISVTVRTWRERVLAEAEVAAAASGGAIDVTATLPGLVVVVAVATGDTVVAGQSLLTVEAMKMQNEVRAPRDGRVGTVAVAPGTAVATGALLLRLEEAGEAGPG